MPDRIIKESICTSETLSQLSDFEERFWTHLTVCVDDYGRFDARAAILKSRLFPLRQGTTDRNISDALHRLSSVGLVDLYEVDGKPFLQLITWAKHQRIRNKRSKYPSPVDGNPLSIDSKSPQSAVNCVRNPIQSESNPISCSTAPSDFDIFWKAYPKKVGKGAAQKSFEKIDSSLYPSILAAVEAQKKCEQWKRDGGQYIPYPATWLNQRRWEDEITEREDAQNGQSRFSGVV